MASPLSLSCLEKFDLTDIQRNICDVKTLRESRVLLQLTSVIYVSDYLPFYSDNIHMFGREGKEYSFHFGLDVRTPEYIRTRNSTVVNRPTRRKLL